MSKWHVFARDPIDDPLLASELAMWLSKQNQELRLFREGATLCDLTWAAANLITPDQIGLLWLVRMFCERFELLARRRDCEADGSWQLRIIGPASDLPDGQPVRPVGKPTSTMLLGEHEANGEFVGTPNRYRRARLVYPVAGNVERGATCGLTVRHFTLETAGDCTEAASDSLLSCWTSVCATTGQRKGTSANDRS